VQQYDHQYASTHKDHIHQAVDQQSGDLKYELCQLMTIDQLAGEQYFQDMMTTRFIGAAT
jgi:hypothetical protein